MFVDKAGSGNHQKNLSARFSLDSFQRPSVLAMRAGSSSCIRVRAVSRVELAGDSLLGDDIEDTESKEALEHLSNQAAEIAWKHGDVTDCRPLCQAPLPAKRHRIGTQNMSSCFSSFGVVSFSLCSAILASFSRFGATLATEKARRVYFVCPDLYEAYREQAEQKRRHSFTESALLET